MRKYLILIGLLPSVAFGQAIPLSKAVDEFIGTEISISGKIGYDETTISGYNFVFFDEEESEFNVIMDAGRIAREEVQAKCEEELTIVWDTDDFCKVEAKGILTVSGSSIIISVDEILSLTSQITD